VNTAKSIFPKFLSQSLQSLSLVTSLEQSYSLKIWQCSHFYPPITTALTSISELHKSTYHPTVFLYHIKEH